MRPIRLSALLTLGAVTLGACARPHPVANVAPERGRHEVAGDEIRERRVVSLEDMFRARVSGVQLVSRPDGDTSVRIRGSGGFLSDGEPLYVIDGLAVTPDGRGLQSIASAVTPQDIARIEVLKDAVSLAGYGIQGANGVIRITTKHGP